ncbi:hypothetical protein P7H41_13185 [Vagococcus fluvialis]|uniref:DUF6711 family protein n=1 Tax=Vagococcus fluvialis TaxID=2738 RepID=UPI00288CF253|nr:DUF6711 family protein [Vagococcus fluvialis]MDT2782897.1 hypothetical protein [Vagococcus fluvialis]
MSGTLMINGVTVKPPQEFSATLNTIDADSSGRNANGTMVRDIITQKVKIECKWGPLSDSEASTILKAVKDKFITINYPDPEIGGQTTKTFYVGDRSAPSYSWNNKFSQAKWQGLSMNFIER